MKRQKKQYYSLKSFFTYLSHRKPAFFLVFSVFVISNVLLALLPLFVGKLVGALTSTPIEGHKAVIFVWILILCSSFHNYTWRLAEFLHMKFMNPTGYEYENVLFERVISKPYPYFVGKFTGKLSSYITSISQELREFLTNVFYDYTNLFVSLIVAAGILTSVNKRTGAIFVGGVTALYLIGRLTIRNTTTYEQKSADVQSDKNARLIDAIANFVNVKSFQQEHREIATIKSEQGKTIAAATTSYKWAIVFWGSMSLIIRDFMWPATIGLNVYLFMHHEISIGELATLLTTILLFSSTIWNFIWFISQLNLKLARIEEAHRYLFGPVNIIKETGEELRDAPPLAFTSELELKGLNFAYPDKVDTPVLSNLKLTLKRGEKIGIVGRSGSGKTTLTKLLLGYYDNEEGQVLLDGKPTQGKDLASIISYVPQDTSLFHRSVADNIAYAARGKVSREDIVAAAKRAHADEFIAKIDEGYDAMVGERGVKLSAGQRQRIAIARALLDNKPILILDEATSALDSESEVLVQEGLEALWEQKTVIAIAHRLSTLRHMDKIIVMDKGQIIEEGTHKQLIASKGAYSKLWNHQSGGFIEED